MGPSSVPMATQRPALCPRSWSAVAAAGAAADRETTGSTTAAAADRAVDDAPPAEATYEPGMRPFLLHAARETLCTEGRGDQEGSEPLRDVSREWELLPAPAQGADTLHSRVRDIEDHHILQSAR